MRVLAVTQTLGSHGAALCLARTLIALKQAGASVDLAYQGQEPLAQVLKNNGIDIILTNAVDANCYDVALVNILEDHPAVLQLAPHLPVVFWVHEGASILGQTDKGPRWSEAFRSSSRIVFQTRWQVEKIFASFLNHVQPHRIVCVAPGVYLPQQLVELDTQQAPRVLSVGSVYPRKRPEDLVAAVMRLTDLPLHCTLVGSLDWLHMNSPAMLQSIQTRPDLFELTGDSTLVDDVLSPQHLSAHHHRAQLYCSASVDETFGSAIMEAAAAGLPLALTDLPCHQGTWKHGINALFSPPGDVHCLSWNLRALSMDKPLAERLRNQAAQTAQRFGMQRFLQSMIDVLVAAHQDRLHIQR